MHSLEYAILILGTKIERELDQDLGKTLCELAGCASQYQPPEGPEYQSGCPDENFLKQHIRIHELNFTDLKLQSRTGSNAKKTPKVMHR